MDDKEDPSLSSSTSKSKSNRDLNSRNSVNRRNLDDSRQQQHPLTPAPRRQSPPMNEAASANAYLSSRLQSAAGDESFGISTVDDDVNVVSPCGSPFEAPQRYQTDLYYGPLRASSTLRHVQRVSKRAALASKKVIWDSNDNAIDAAQSAVDQWEEAYNALRGLLVASTQSAFKLYGAAKTGATGLEHGILVPVRDWILLPAFDAAEKTVGFLQSNQAHQVASQSLQLAHQVPWIGPTVLAPSLVLSVQMFQTAWQIAQYPIPSRHQVRNSVDFVLTGTKWTLSTAMREVLMYLKRADAIITRTLSHTRWKVLGSGPYETLDKLNKQEVIDHICERYFSLKGTIARYELAAHIRAHNLPLYLDLVLTGLLRERGGELTKDDEWLSSCPIYRKNSKCPFLLPNYHAIDEERETKGDNQSIKGAERQELESGLSDKESALWFRLPNINGKRPGRDMPWVRFNGEDRVNLERRYLEVFREGKCSDSKPSLGTEGALKVDGGVESPATSEEEEDTDETNHVSEYSSCQSDYFSGNAGGDKNSDGISASSGYPTVAQWHVPDLERDVMVDQKRYSVSYYNCCPRCRQKHDPSTDQTLNLESNDTKDSTSLPPTFGDVCRSCADNEAAVTNHWMASSILSPPPLSMLMRPNLWRFHGPGDDVRRAVWFLDTRRHGLQPYGEEAQAVLEDAYLFLKWRKECLKESADLDANDRKRNRKPVLENTCPENVNAPQKDKLDDEEPIEESAVLTVQVESPDGGEQQLVQFSSLTAATAIQKGLGGAISLFKRRVYRGADLSHPKVPDSAHGVTPEAVFSGDVNLKSQQRPSTQKTEPPDNIIEDDDGNWTTLALPGADQSLTVPASQFDDIDREPLKQNEKEKGTPADDIDHLVLIVHGIGEMLRSVDIFGLSVANLSTIVDCCGYMRKNHAEVQSARFSQMYPTSESISTAATGRVEYLPIEWHEAFSIMSQRMSPSASQAEMSPTERQLVRSGSRSSQVMIEDISLRTIPQMRTFANDTLMDVLYFMSAEHHDTIIDIVVSEMNVVVQKFRALTGFEGRISVIGHSLGSIISWDILAHQFPGKRADSFAYANKDAPSDKEDADNYEENSGSKQNNSSSSDEGIESNEQVSSAMSDSLFRDPSSSWQYPKLQFDVDNAFMLGSPIAVFLMVRNQRKPLSADYALSGCSRVFNIFHPYDPVAYRIEPLIDPRNAEFEPRIMTHWNGGFRVQYQTKRLWRKFLQTTMQTQQNVFERLECLLDSVDEEDDQSQPSNQSDPSGGVNEDNCAAIATGKVNQGRRIDYMLQEKEIEAANEYVAAFAAHSCYWQEKDMSLFVARQIYLSRLAHEQAVHFEDLIPYQYEGKI